MMNTRRHPIRASTIIPILIVGTMFTTCSLNKDRQIFVLVLIDTLRRDALGCYGNDPAVSPWIDAIAAEGIRFDQAVSTSGWTLPAVASLMTGAWPSIHGAWGKGASLTPIRDELPTAAEIFADHGFATLAVANAAFVSPLLGLDRGFDVYDHVHAQNQRIRRADETIDAALGHMRSQLGRDQFVFVHIFDPHLDYDPPDGYRTTFVDGRGKPPPPLSMATCRGMQQGDSPPLPADIAYIRGLYHGEVTFVDRQIGRLVEGLKEMGLYDRATLVILSDHGEEFWDHGDFEHGHTLYDELILIPLIVKPASGLTPVRRTVESQVRILDIVPTFFELAGIPQPESFVGRSLPGLIRQEGPDERIAFSENPLYGPEKVSWRTERYKLIYDLSAEPMVGLELYDRRNDPGETENLVASHPELARNLYREMFVFVQGLQDGARAMSQPEIRDMSPQTIESLKSLGYIR